MSKHRTKSQQSQESSEGLLSIQLPVPVIGCLLDSKQAFMDLCLETGRQTLLSMMESDRAVLCGEKGRHGMTRQARRGGSTPSRITLGGRQIEIPRLRVRDGDGELSLSSFHWASQRDPLNTQTLKAIAAGVSTRKYGNTLESLPAEEPEHLISKSSVSRRFVALSLKKMHEYLSRPLDEMDIRVIFIDGKYCHDHCLLIAMGVNADGSKGILGVWEGTTENTRTATALITDLVERGLATERPVLFVIDGAKALRKAIRNVFGEYGLVQRCQEHKRRNVLAHLPATMHPSIRRALGDAWQAKTADGGQRQLERLANSLQRDHPGAAASVREGLEETLTLQRLGVSGALYRVLRTTNPIENLNGSVAWYCRNVKRWRGGQMVLRWVCAALSDAEQKFRRVQGYRDMPRLIAKLDQTISMSESSTAKIA